MKGLALVEEPTNELPGAEQLTPRRSSPESEAAVLGLILTEPEYLPQVRQFLTKDDFAAKRHEWIFEAMCDLADNGKLCDVLAVCDYLKLIDPLSSEGESRLVDCGGRTYLTDVMMQACNAAFLRHTCERIWDFSKKRQMGSGFTKLQNRLSEGIELHDLTHQVQNLVDKARPRVDIPWKATDLMAALSEAVEARSNNEDKIGLRVNFGALDGITRGFKPGALIVLGGRPSMGKTMFALNMLQNVAVQRKKPVAFFSLEMTIEEVLERMLVRQAHIEADFIKTGAIAKDTDQWAQWTVAQCQIMDAAPICLFDGRHRINTLSGIKARIKEMQSLGIELSAIGIDYIQLMNGENPGKTLARNYELEAVSRGLKQLANELGIPIFVLSQLGREVAKRPNKRPELQDLRDSGSLEQDADIVMFIYRDEVYNKNSPDKGLAELIISKHRNGELDTVVLEYKPQYQSFYDSAFKSNDLKSLPQFEETQYKGKSRKSGSTHAAHTETDN